MKKHWLYILKLNDGSYYTGITNNLRRRMRQHQESKPHTSFVSTRKPFSLVYHETHENRRAVLAREKQIKRWSRAKKEALIEGDIEKLKRLSSGKSEPTEG